MSKETGKPYILLLLQKFGENIGSSRSDEATFDMIISALEKQGYTQEEIDKFLAEADPNYRNYIRNPMSNPNLAWLRALLLNQNK